MAAAILSLLVILSGYESWWPVLATEEKVTSNFISSGSFGYKILISKMEFIEHHFLEQQLELQQMIDLVMQNQNRLEESLKTSEAATRKQIDRLAETSEAGIQKLNDVLVQNQDRFVKTISEVLLPKLNLLSDKLTTVTINTNNSLQLELENKDSFEKTKEQMTIHNEQCKISSILTSMNETVSEKFSTVLSDLKSVKSRMSTLPIASCSDINSTRSGLYQLQPFVGEESLEVYCEQALFGGGWLVIHHRFDGSLNFFRNWTEYKEGFGKPSGEFWFGLEKLHRLTTAKKHSLIVELSRKWNNKYGYAMYSEFEIGGEDEGYSLKRLGEYSGTAGDSLNPHKGMKFTTADRDNDLADDNCAETWRSAWWFKDCLDSHLNGEYPESPQDEKLQWTSFEESLTMMRMMIRETE